MNYWILQESQRSHVEFSQITGIAVIVSEDYTQLLRMEALKQSVNLTPWLRRRTALPVSIPERYRTGTPARTDRATLREFIRLARRGSADELVQATVHATAERFVVHAQLGGATASRVIPAKAADLRVLLTRLKLRYGRLAMTLIGQELSLLNMVHSFALESGMVFEVERMRDLVTVREREPRDVLVVTNIGGAALPHLEDNLDFWSRGPAGCRFRHIYGQLTARRAENALARRHWDMIIYRGHARAIGGRVAWQTTDGDFPLPVGVCSTYVHLACLGQPESLALDALPAHRVITPLSLLPDFDDAAFTRELIGRMQKSGNFMGSLRSVQRTYPQFAGICTD